jgi:hypothetical protein
VFTQKLGINSYCIGTTNLKDRGDSNFGAKPVECKCFSAELSVPGFSAKNNAKMTNETPIEMSEPSAMHRGNGGGGEDEEKPDVIPGENGGADGGGDTKASDGNSIDSHSVGGESGSGDESDTADASEGKIWGCERVTEKWLNVELPLSDIRFSHATVFDRFQNGELVTTLRDQLREYENDANAINRKLKRCRLQVVEYHGRYHSMSNRRLWALKEAVAPNVKIRVDLHPSPQTYSATFTFLKKLTTRNNGMSAQMVHKVGGAADAAKQWIMLDCDPGVFIGKQGVNIKGLQEKFRVRVKCNNEISPFCCVWGDDADAVEEAATQIRCQYVKKLRTEEQLHVDYPDQLTKVDRLEARSNEEDDDSGDEDAEVQTRASTIWKT